MTPLPRPGAIHNSMQQPMPRFRLAFRPTFLLGASFSIVALLLWSLVMGNLISFSPYGGLMWWHIHEMLFGFTLVIMSGFLLSAVKSWTGITPVDGTWLLILPVLTQPSKDGKAG